MLGQNISMSQIKYAAGCILGTLAFLVVLIFRLIFGSYTLGFLVFLALLWILIFKIGIIIMYPGSSAYFRSETQDRLSADYIRNLQEFGQCLHMIQQMINTKSCKFQMRHVNLEAIVYGNIQLMIEMLSMFQHTLSERKQKLLDIFRKMLEEIEYINPQSSFQHQEGQAKISSLKDFMELPAKIKQNIVELQHNFLIHRSTNMLELNSELQMIVQSYVAPENSFLDKMKFKFFGQKLYEIRFGYQLWNNVFEYEVHLINNITIVLECAILKKYKRRPELSRHSPEPPSSLESTHPNKYVMFCNPNGVYIQFFALQNAYIKQYINQGYQIILWNYRGYGQSTGHPSITKSQTDAMKVYNYFTERNMKIQIVHGYSIGGCAAIGLVSKLEIKSGSRGGNNSNSKRISNNRNNRNDDSNQSNSGLHLSNTSSSSSSLRSQNNSNNIKLLIVDRSFSSIGNVCQFRYIISQMAIQFGPLLHKLAKIIFTFQNKNLSDQFSQLKTEKLMIWDHRDEVIPNSASLKNGILSALIQKQAQSDCDKCTKCYKQDEQRSRLNEQVSVLINQTGPEDSESEGIDDTQFEELNAQFVEKFSNCIKILLTYIKQVKQESGSMLGLGSIQLSNVNDALGEQILAENDGNALQSSLNDKINYSQQFARKTMQQIYEIDGGGFFLPYPASSFKAILVQNSISFECKCQSYFLGLIFYGSLYPIKVAFASRKQIQTHTMTKLTDLISHLQDIKGSEQISTIPKDLQESIHSLIRIFSSVKNIIQTSFLLEQYKKFGKLVAVSNGHNGPLNNEQLRHLINYIKEVCTTIETRNTSDSLNRSTQDNSEDNRMSLEQRDQQQSLDVNYYEQGKQIFKSGNCIRQQEQVEMSDLTVETGDQIMYERMINE